jgi:aldehyde dehydrogenase (NAD+)
MITAESEPRMLIGGELVDASTGQMFDNVDPATEQVLGSVADATREDMERAIGAARDAFDRTSWSTEPAWRRACLEQLRDALDAEREAFRRELVAEVGCTISSTYTSRLDPPLNRSFAYYIDWLESFSWQRDAGLTGPAERLSGRTVFKEAVGVIGAITAWNSPLELALAKVVPALATGNAVVLKPAPDTPFSATRLGRLIAEQTEIPEGIVNIVTSSDHGVGETLTADPRVDMISFTGSAATGRRIMANASATLKRLQFELGGKAAHVVLDDADVSRAVAASMNICLNAGQSCGALSRLLLPRKLYGDGVEELRARFAEVRVGSPADPETEMGPLINGVQRGRVLGYIAAAVREGVKLAAGGGIPHHLSHGYYIQPTLFIDVDPAAEIAQEEVFGPVLCVIPYEDDDDAVRIANDTKYGLSAAVTSASADRALEVAGRLRAGAVTVNGGATFARDVPFGGYKQSGIGRQNGPEGLEEMLETKTVGFPA